jgi:hypothetical protein
MVDQFTVFERRGFDSARSDVDPDKHSLSPHLFQERLDTRLELTHILRRII